MSNDLIIYEAGIRMAGKYCKFTESPDKKNTLDYIEVMKVTKPEKAEIVMLEKTYRLISTVPYVISEGIEEEG